MTYQEAMNYRNAVRECFRLMLCTSNTDIKIVKHNNTIINYNAMMIELVYNDRLVLDIQKLWLTNHRLEVSATKSNIMFYNAHHDNAVAHINLRPGGLFHDDYDVVGLLDLCSEEEWDSTQFQYSTIYRPDVVYALMLEPIITSVLEKYSGNTQYRIKQYQDEGRWLELPFKTITQDIWECSRKI